MNVHAHTHTTHANTCKHTYTHTHTHAHTHTHTHTHLVHTCIHTNQCLRCVEVNGHWRCTCKGTPLYTAAHHLHRNHCRVYVRCPGSKQWGAVNTALHCSLSLQCTSRVQSRAPHRQLLQFRGRIRPRLSNTAVTTPTAPSAHTHTQHVHTWTAVLYPNCTP